MNEKAVFAAGCFWHVQQSLDSVSGILMTQVGYMGGNEKKFSNPGYEDVCRGDTGYAEVVYLEFDPKKLKYEDLVKTFFKIHDPTQFHKQGPDIGSQYRSAIFYFNDKQKKLAEKLLKDFQTKTQKKIVTEIVKAGKFVRAEEYHQKYYKKHPIFCKVLNLFGSS